MSDNRADVLAGPGRHSRLGEGGRGQIEKLFRLDEWPPGDIDNVFRLQFEIQAARIHGGERVDLENLGSVERSADDDNRALVSAIGEAAARSKGANDGRVVGVRHRAGQANFAEL